MGNSKSWTFGHQIHCIASPKVMSQKMALLGAQTSRSALSQSPIIVYGDDLRSRPGGLRSQSLASATLLMAFAIAHAPWIFLKSLLNYRLSAGQDGFASTAHISS